MAREAPAPADAGSDDPASISGRDLALLIGMNLIWGLNLIASKIGVEQIPPVFFTALRFGALALILIPFLRLHRGQMLNLLAAAIFTGPLAPIVGWAAAGFLAGDGAGQLDLPRAAARRDADRRPRSHRLVRRGSRPAEDR
mgnify:CR=1 FL=1